MANNRNIREALIITMEECGELVQACSKVIRTMEMKDSAKTRKRHLENLQDEIGDVMCMIEILKMAGLVNDQNIDIRMQVKKRKLERWSSLFEEDE